MLLFVAESIIIQVLYVSCTFHYQHKGTSISSDSLQTVLDSFFSLVLNYQRNFLRMLAFYSRCLRPCGR